MDERAVPAPDQIVRMATEAYLEMTNREVVDLDDEAVEDVLASELLALEELVKLRRFEGDAAVFLTLTRIVEEQPGALQLLAAQAIVELDDLDFVRSERAAGEDAA
jgi:hypothetical protein